MPPEITRERVNFAMNRKVKWRQLTKRRDIFGREYIIWVDRNNLEPVGQIERHFTAPVWIPDEYLKYPEDQPWLVETDFVGYATYLKQERQVWEQSVRAHMKRLYGALGVEKAAGAPTPQALEVAGPPPQDWRLIILMMRGDPWTLGLQRKRTKAVELIIGKAEDEEISEKQRQIKVKSLELDPELEAAVGKGALAARKIDPRAQAPVTRMGPPKGAGGGKAGKGGGKSRGRGTATEDPDDDGPEEPRFPEGTGGGDEDGDEDILTGDAPLPGLDDDLESLDLTELDDEHDPTGIGGRNIPVGSTRPRKPRGEGKD